MWNNGNNGSGMEGVSAASAQVTMMIAGPGNRTQLWYGALSADNRFRITTLATSAEDFVTKLSTHPDVILLDASIFPNPDAFVSALRKVGEHIAVYAVLPEMDAETQQTLTRHLEQYPPVKGVYHVDVNLTTLAEEMYGGAVMAHMQRQERAHAWGSSAPQGVAPVSTRIIAVWSLVGGAGKTTTASNLAYEAARRGYPTLLIGTGAPDDLPLRLGLRARPNITVWHANPTQEGLRASIQKLDTLDVIAGYPDAISESQAMDIPAEDPASIKALVNAALQDGYAIIVIDAPPTTFALPSLMAANTLVVVARPTDESVYRTQGGVAALNQLFGLHHIAPNRMYTLLNGMRDSAFVMDARSWHQAASSLLGRPFPPVIAQIPWDFEIQDLQQQKVLPIRRMESYRKALNPLADALFADIRSARGEDGGASGKKTFKLGPIKVKL